MADYKDIVGTAVRNNAGNLPTADQQDQIFFDTTNIDFKYLFPNVLSSWRTGNSLNTGRAELAGDQELQTSGTSFWWVLFTWRTEHTESYDGISFTEVADLNTARSGLGGAGASQHISFSIWWRCSC